ncbi:MAG: exodeoxyribonuclease VII small subunit [Firmicutes bacterium]|nr:exodeoxyribonuclease VII small subunit [Bacillota bacterium]
MAKKLTLEQAFVELESLSSKLEIGNKTLSESLKIYDKANELINFCEKTISEAKEKIKNEL